MVKVTLRPRRFTTLARIVFVVLLLLLDDGTVGTVPVCGAVVDAVPAAADATATTATTYSQLLLPPTRYGFFLLLSLVD